MTVLNDDPVEYHVGQPETVPFQALIMSQCDHNPRSG
jgi:hypothetical protein